LADRFIGLESFRHGRTPKLGIVVVNLGTPAEPTTAAVRRYLAEFLSDPRVVEIPSLVWKAVLHGIVLRTRPARSAHAYASIWTDAGSPLMVESAALTEGLRSELQHRIPGPVTVELGMRYGQPSIKDVLGSLQRDGMERLLVLPLYPQYSGATTGSVADAVFSTLATFRWMPEVRLMGSYCDDPRYIRSISDSIRDHWRIKGRGDRLLLSFHGMPRATLEAGDPYFCQCHKSARLIATELGLQQSEWEMTFQSRFGPAEWLQPYTAVRLEALPAEGAKHITVACPGFACDCLETLEEINMQGRNSFLKAGGKRFEYVPALNSGLSHIRFQAARMLEHACGWPELSTGFDPAQLEHKLETTRAQASSAGASH